MLCHSPASLLEGGGGTGAGGVLGIQPHYDLLFLPRPIGAYSVAAHKRLVRQPLVIAPALPLLFPSSLARFLIGF